MKPRTVIVSCIAVCMLFSASTFAGVGLDFKGGLNLAKLRGDDVDLLEDFGLETGMNLGMIAGMGVGIKIGDYFAIQPEFLFSQKGLKMSVDDEDAFIKLGYLEIPVLFKLNIPAGAVLPNFYVGPALSINVSSKTVDPDDNEEDMKEYTKGVDFGLAMGGGLDIVAGPGRVIIEIRYTLGFMTIDDPEDEDVDAADMKNGVLSFIVGYGIDLGE